MLISFGRPSSDGKPCQTYLKCDRRSVFPSPKWQGNWAPESSPFHSVPQFCFRLVYDKTSHSKPEVYQREVSGKSRWSISNRDSGKHCLVRIFFTKSVNQFSEEFLPYFVETCAILRDLLVGQYNFAERKASRSHCCLSLSPAPFFCSFYLLLTH